MKQKVLLSVGLIASLFVLRACSVGSGDPYTGTAFSEDGGCDGSVCNAAIPLSNTEGVSMVSVDAFRVDICAEPTKTISDAGAIWIWSCKAKDGLCSHNVSLDQPITGSGERCQTFPDFKVGYVTQDADTLVARPVGVSVTGADAGGGYSISTTVFTHKERYR